MNNFMDALGGITPDVGHVLLKTFAEVSEQNRKDKQMSLDRQKMVQDSMFKDLDMKRKESDFDMRAYYKADAASRADEKDAWDKLKHEEDAPLRQERILAARLRNTGYASDRQSKMDDVANSHAMLDEMEPKLDESGNAGGGLLNDLASEDPVTAKDAQMRANNIISRFKPGPNVNAVIDRIEKAGKFVAKRNAEATRAGEKDEDQAFREKQFAANEEQRTKANTLAREKKEASDAHLAFTVRKYEEKTGAKASNGLTFGDERARILRSDKESLTMEQVRSILALPDSSKDRENLVKQLANEVSPGPGKQTRKAYPYDVIQEWSDQGRAIKAARDAEEEAKKAAPRSGSNESFVLPTKDAPTAPQLSPPSPTGIALPPIPLFSEIQDTKRGFDAHPGNQAAPTSATPADEGVWRVSPRDPSIEINDTTKQARRKQ